MFQQALKSVKIERDAARRSAEEILESLLAHKAELQGALTTIFILASRNGGAVSITTAELEALPPGMSVRVSSDHEKGIHTYTTEVQAQAGPETPANENDDATGAVGASDPDAPIMRDIPGTGSKLVLG